MLGKQLIQGLLFFSLLVAASIVDVRKREIPDSVSIGIALASLLLFAPQNLLGILAALPMFIAAITVDGMGGGDVKLTAAAGLVLGLTAGMAGVVFGLTAMLLFYAMGIPICKVRGVVMTKSLPLAPFLSLGFIAAYFMKIGGLIL